MIPKEAMELTLEQQFELRKMEEDASRMGAAELRSLVIQAARLAMVRQNVIILLTKRTLGMEVANAE